MKCSSAIRKNTGRPLRNNTGVLPARVKTTSILHNSITLEISLLLGFQLGGFSKSVEAGMSRLFLKTLIIFGIFLLSGIATAQEQKPAAIDASGIYKQWTGDLDGMVNRRAIRALVPYNKMTYFIDHGTQRGIAYDSMMEFEKILNEKFKLGKLRLHIIFIPVSRDELFQGLVDGKGDISFGNLTVTDERLKVVDFTEPLAVGVNEIVVTGPGAPKISTVDDLSGQTIFVRKSSSYYESLVKLNAQLKAKGKKEVVLKLAPEQLENEDLIEMANAGLVKILVVDKHIANFWKQIFPNVTVHENVVLRTGGALAWAIRKNSPQLKAELNAFVKTHAKGTLFGNMKIQKYLKSLKYVKNSTSEAELKKYENIREFFKKYGDQYSVDWLLMAAQGYQESRLDQTVKSPVGAIGVMQLMPATGKDMKTGDISQVEPNIHAGVKYMRFMIDQFYKNEPMTELDKMLFTFASYNAGPGRMNTMRKETQKRGLNPNVWFGNVERIVSEKIGQETVSYVSNIYKYYIAYKLTAEEQAERRKLKQQTSSKP
jgi:membrane-bound lytic murein transglycosylase MltF